MNGGQCVVAIFEAMAQGQVTPFGSSMFAREVEGAVEVAVAAAQREVGSGVVRGPV